MKPKLRRFLIIAVVAAGASCNLVGRNRSKSEPSSTPPQHNQASPSRPNSSNYKEARTHIESERVALSSSYQRARNPTEKSEIINRARERMSDLVYSELFPYWYGTPWDFNGTTETPGQGKIACGYFVTTVLRDLGVKVERARLAQQASENIILSLTTDAHIKRFRQRPIRDFVQEVQNWGPGVYVVGLDIHVGFIMNVDGQVYFIHSSYVDPYSVIKEPAGESKILTSSRYRVLGKISADDQFIEKWLRGSEIATRM